VTAVTLVRRIAARRSIVFDALVTPEGLTSWWGPEDLPVLSATADVHVGGHFCVRFWTLDGSEHECTGQFLEVVRPERIAMSWRWSAGGEPEEQGAESRVEFHLREIDTGTELTLIHSALRNEISAHSHEWGWDGALKKLLRRFGEDEERRGE
jgi:uncharacterized protein YndB with AHSA1/START domain